MGRTQSHHATFMDRFELQRVLTEGNQFFPMEQLTSGFRRDGCFEDDKRQRVYAVNGKQFISRAMASVECRNSFGKFLPKEPSKFSGSEWLKQAVHDQTWPRIMDDKERKNPLLSAVWVNTEQDITPKNIPGDWCWYVWHHEFTNSYHVNLHWCATRVKLFKTSNGFEGAFTGLLDGRFDCLEGFLRIAKFALTFRSSHKVIAGFNGESLRMRGKVT